MKFCTSEEAGELGEGNREDQDLPIPGSPRSLVYGVRGIPVRVGSGPPPLFGIAGSETPGPKTLERKENGTLCERRGEGTT